MVDLLALLVVFPAVLELLVLEVRQFTHNLVDCGSLQALLLHLVSRKAKDVIGRVREHVVGDVWKIGGEKASEQTPLTEALSLKKSYAVSFNMIAVAVGRGLTQMPVLRTNTLCRALSLHRLQSPHWHCHIWARRTGRQNRPFVISLVSGLLSVYYACMVQLELGNLQNSTEVKRWLTTYRTRSPWENGLLFCRINRVPIHEYRKLTKQGPVWHIPSYYAAMLVVTPSLLLNWSLSSLLIGIGIYYGLVFTEDLGLIRGRDSNLAVLIVYIVFTTTAAANYLVPVFMKQVEVTESSAKALRKRSNVFSDSDADAHKDPESRNIKIDPTAVTAVAHTSTDDPDHTDVGSSGLAHNLAYTDQVLHALQQSITAQAAGLRAQEASLRAHDLPSTLARPAQAFRLACST
jgi:hypothetical protein